MKVSLLTLMLLFVSFGARAQVRTTGDAVVQILKAEDARRYDQTLESLLRHPNEQIRTRAALATGRIGDDRAVAPLSIVLINEESATLRAMAAFALGEIESVTAADAILKALNNTGTPEAVRSRAVEAAGKIAAANGKDPSAKNLGEAILDTLEAEYARGAKQHRDTVLLALTAALRARPEETDVIVARFLTNLDARVRADAANTLARIRAKNANAALRTMLMTDPDPIARANAARALGAAEDKEALDPLLVAATEDADSRVRVSAIRSLVSLREAKAAERLVGRGRELMKVYGSRRREIDGPERVLPPGKNELLEVATALGRLLANTKHEAGWKFLEGLRYADKHYSPEVEVAMARVDPEKFLTVSNVGGVYLSRKTGRQEYDWQAANSLHAALGEYAVITADTPSNSERAQKKLEEFIANPLEEFPKADPASVYPALASGLNALARFKPAEMNAVAIRHLTHPDVQVRAAAAAVLADLPSSRGKTEALEKAFATAIISDKAENDAQLAILDAMAKIDKGAAVDTFYLALDSPDYLVRRKAFELLNDPELIKKYPGAVAVVENARAQKRHLVWPFDPKTGTKLGQMLSTDADYRRALARRNGRTKAVVTTQKGTFTIDLLPEDAPLTVDNFVKLARTGYFNGLEVHRVVPNFVMQDGDPRGDGNGGPGWSIRCEINTVPYERGAVGMALSGKDTGGSQWFVTHSPQPHLDGGYTVFGRVNESGMKVVDKIVRGDKIINVRVVEGISPQRTQRVPRR